MDPTLCDRLRDLYARLEERLSARHRLQKRHRAANPCGSCFQCCTASGRRRHGVTEVELAYMEAAVGAERTGAFRAYATAEADESGALKHPVCPNYDVEEHRCNAYEARPYSCRVFGHFRLEDSRLPPDCVFEGTEETFLRNAYASQVPLARELIDLDWEFRCRQAKRAGGAAAGSIPSADQAPPPGTVERALFHQFRGEKADADGAFAAAVEAAPESAYTHYSWGLFCTQEGRHEEAAGHYRRACEREPGNGHYLLQLGSALMQTGQTEEARATLQRSSALDPAGGTAEALLGYMELAAGRIPEAANRFAEACRREPANAAFQRARAEARKAEPL